MARLFDDASSEYLYINTGILTAPPFAMSCLFRTDADVTVCPMFLGDKDNDNRYFLIIVYNVAGGNIARCVVRQDATVVYADTSTTITQGTWHNVVYIEAATNDRRIFLDGGGKGTDTTNCVPVGVDRFALGALAQPSIGYYMSGDIAETALWNLTNWPGATAADKANNFEKAAISLGKKFTPEFFSLGRVGYWDLRSGIKDQQGAYDLTASGTAASAHSRIIRPASVLYGVADAYVPPASEGGIMTCNTGFWGAI